MKKLNANDLNDMLKDAGVSSAVHRHQIIEARHENNNNTPNVVLEDVTGENNEHFFDVYLSHAGSSHGRTELASLLAFNLQIRGFSIYNPSEHLEQFVEQTHANMT